MDYQARRQARAQETRRAILDSAVRLTRERGFDKVTSGTSVPPPG